MKNFRIGVAAVIAVGLSACATSVRPPSHPNYAAAISDLRIARTILDREPEYAVARNQYRAIEAIDRAVLERGIHAVFGLLTWEMQGFAVATGYDSATGRYTGLALPHEDTPPQLTGTFTSPWPFIVGLRAIVPRANTGKPSASMSPASRDAPSITTPLTPSPRAQVLKYSPHTARDISARASMTSTSPGRT